MLGREVEGDAMGRIAQECLAGDLGSKHTGFAFDAEVALEAAVPGNEADHGLGEVNVEIVTDDVPPRVAGCATQQVAEKTSEIFFGPPIADHALDLAGGRRRRRRSGLECRGGGTRPPAARPCPAPSAVPARCAPTLECRSSRRWKWCDECHRRRLQPYRPRRCRRTCCRKRDRASGSASYGSDGV